MQMFSLMTNLRWKICWNSTN